MVSSVSPCWDLAWDVLMTVGAKKCFFISHVQLLKNFPRIYLDCFILYNILLNVFILLVITHF